MLSQSFTKARKKKVIFLLQLVPLTNHTSAPGFYRHLSVGATISRPDGTVVAIWAEANNSPAYRIYLYNSGTGLISTKTDPGGLSNFLVQNIVNGTLLRNFYLDDSAGYYPVPAIDYISTALYLVYVFYLTTSGQIELLS